MSEGVIPIVRIVELEQQVDHLRDTVAHLEFDVDCAKLDALQAEAQRSPEVLAWLAAKTPEGRSEGRAFLLRDHMQQREIEDLHSRVAFLEARQTELQEANTREVERRREAEAEIERMRVRLRDAKEEIDALRIVAGIGERAGR